MRNPLTGSVKIVDQSPSYVVWYTPAGFDTVETDAQLHDGDGDLLLVWSGTRYKIIATEQVKRIVTGQWHAWSEVLAEEWETDHREQTKIEAYDEARHQ